MSFLAVNSDDNFRFLKFSIALSISECFAVGSTFSFDETILLEGVC